MNTAEKEQIIAILERIADRIRKWDRLGIPFAELLSNQKELLRQNGCSEEELRMFCQQELLALDYAIKVLKNRE